MKALKLAEDIYRKCRDKIETIQHITGACHALTQGDYTHYHHPVAKNVHQELTMKRGPYKRLPMPYFKYEPLPLLKDLIHYTLRDPQKLTFTITQNKHIYA